MAWRAFQFSSDKSEGLTIRCTNCGGLDIKPLEAGEIFRSDPEILRAMGVTEHDATGLECGECTHRTMAVVFEERR